ncbi:Holliday junction resolvase RuvX [Microbacterium gorillae]|uniref:Holliday junction resolvase RuvX n=1 Tax=Microbacterium gorillae TaxID=1231063 RepID=UPI00058CEF31|nr:Holliday junction resolvase RuvX [Microbacterium gorillae]
MTDFRRGVRIGVDVGKARVGVARCDPDGMLATPVETVPRDDAAVARVLAIAAEQDAVAIVVGLPLNLRGEDTPSTADARAFAAALRAADLPVHMIDERLTTVSAHSQLRSVGRNQKQSRGIVDQVAAVVLLQQAIDIEKRTGNPAGEPVPPQEQV